MPIRTYVKAQHTPRLPVRKHPGPPFALSYLFILTGIVILVWALWPIASFMLFTAPQFSGVISPVQDGGIILSPIVNAASPDYTNANVWFPTSPQKKVVSKVTAYTLSIPKLKIR